MNLGEMTPEPVLYWFCLALCLAGLFIAVAAAPWKQLARDTVNGRVHWVWPLSLCRCCGR